MSTTETTRSTTPAPRERYRTVLASIIAGIYCLVLLAPASLIWPEPLARIMATVKSSVYGLTGKLLIALGWQRPGIELQQGAYLMLVGLAVPLVAALLLLRATPASLGFRSPNRTGWRLLVAGFVLTFPFLIFMAYGAGMRSYYLPAMKRAGTMPFLAYYAINMLTEHCLFHGVLLGAFRPTGRWPNSPPPAPATPASGCCAGLRSWLGIGLVRVDPEPHAVAAWLGLAPACGYAIVASGMLFALVHVGKDWREAALSLPGGIAIAYVAFRGNSLLIPLLLHALTAGTTLALMLLW